MLYELRLVYNVDVMFILDVCYMFDNKKKDVPKIVPSDKPSIKEVRQDSNEGLRKSAEPQKRQ